jgi:GrpB-like predicted nucleotidyltransferase (UPF0157 family)/prolyl-tRNA editing enzyme YbaK/EbsC (Cys-tRNA(Pro) deacylase)
MKITNPEPGVVRFKAFLDSHGIQPALVDLPATTHTASAAAQAVSCDLTQIVKSLLFTGEKTGRSILTLVSGTNRVDIQRLSEIVGEKVHLSNTQTVLAVTGYSIGAVSPFGLAMQPLMIIDQDLRAHTDVWISGGSDHVLAKLSFEKLCELSGGKVTPINRTLADPVVILPYDPKWPEQYKVECEAIKSAMDPYLQAIEHIGSTAIPGLPAKPIIDILGGVFNLEDSIFFIAELEKIGYQYVPEFEAQLPERRYLTRAGNDKTLIHLHLTETASVFWRNQQAFRDRLLADDQLRDAYGRLKIELANKYGNDRVGYTDAKSGFIVKVLSGI